MDKDKMYIYRVNIMIEDGDNPILESEIDSSIDSCLLKKPVERVLANIAYLFLLKSW